LKEIAEGARCLVDAPEKWKEDPWLNQLDWTPKAVGKSRGIVPQVGRLVCFSESSKDWLSTETGIGTSFR